MRNEKKSAVITFKAEDELLSALEKVPNKSQFIRAAVLNALAETCPLCGGAGFLNERQLKHWKSFERAHRIHRCGRCDGLEIKCRNHEDQCGKDCEND
ncbi:MAG: CopG family transcriptional regulator [Lentisphaeria bacterium]|nr:CopG family transcriptional regulator [Lentisphaeria bacterium]